MKSYNGFTPEQRQDAQDWINQQYATGALSRPSECCACGHTSGAFDYHAEDYSAPYGAHTVRYPLCYPCHMVVHCRFRSPRSWDLYRAHVLRGERLAKVYRRNWPKFVQDVLQHPEALEWVGGGVPRTVLEEIHNGTA